MASNPRTPRVRGSTAVAVAAAAVFAITGCSESDRPAATTCDDMEAALFYELKDAAADLMEGTDYELETAYRGGCESMGKPGPYLYLASATWDVRGGMRILMSKSPWTRVVEQNGGVSWRDPDSRFSARPVRNNGQRVLALGFVDRAPVPDPDYLS